MTATVDRLARLTAMYGPGMAQDIVEGREDRPPLDEALGRVQAGRNPAYDPTATPGRLALDQVRLPLCNGNHRLAEDHEDPIRVAVRHLIQEEIAAALQERGL